MLKQCIRSGGSENSPGAIVSASSEETPSLVSEREPPSSDELPPSEDHADAELLFLVDLDGPREEASNPISDGEEGVISLSPLKYDPVDVNDSVSVSRSSGSTCDDFWLAQDTPSA